MNRIATRRALLAARNARLSPVIPAAIICLTPPAPRFSSSGQTIFAGSFWKALVPKPLRSGGWKKLFSPNERWNPATFYIIIFLCIGSMSIQMIAMKKDFETFIRQSDTRIGLLREVIERIQKGEKVDVEQILGSGDLERELEWEKVIKDIERDEAAQIAKKRNRSKQNPAEPKPIIKVEGSPATDQLVKKPKQARADFF